MVVDKVAKLQMSADYIKYLRQRVARLEEQWLGLSPQITNRAQTHTRVAVTNSIGGTMSENSTLISYNGRITREELAQVPTPPATETHQPIAHHRVVEALVESMSVRQIGGVADEYAVSEAGMRIFGGLDLEAGFEGCRFAIGLRNSHDKSFRLSCTVGVRVFVCENLAFSGDYTAVLAKHSKNFSLEDSLAIGVDRMQRNFEPMRRQVEEWRARQISTVAAKLIIYQAFVESELDAPKHLERQVHDLYFRPPHPEFEPRTLWSLTNAFTSAFKELEPIPQFKATAKLSGFLQGVRI